MEIDAFLERIGYEDETRTPSYALLAALQRAFLLTVPFENLDIHRDVPILLDMARIYDKIVRQRRGGFCYECNSLLATMLRALGFEVTLVSARMVGQDGSVNPEFDHLALLVALEKRYLADVGNGRSTRIPLALDGGQTSEAEGILYRVGRYKSGYALFFQEMEQSWKPQFLFSTVPRQLSEFAGMCHYHQTSSQSGFLRRQMATIATENGRVTLTDYKLTILKGADKEEHILADEAARLAALSTYFGIQF